VYPSEKTIESGELKDDELEELEEKLELDYQLGDDFKDKVR
jgi:nucleosome assembly protein 1-like 1